MFIFGLYDIDWFVFDVVLDVDVIVGQVIQYEQFEQYFGWIVGNEYQCYYYQQCCNEGYWFVEVDIFEVVEWYIGDYGDVGVEGDDLVILAQVSIGKMQVIYQLDEVSYQGCCCWVG